MDLSKLDISTDLGRRELFGLLGLVMVSPAFGQCKQHRIATPAERFKQRCDEAHKHHWLKAWQFTAIANDASHTITLPSGKLSLAPGTDYSKDIGKESEEIFKAVMNQKGTQVSLMYAAGANELEELNWQWVTYDGYMVLYKKNSFGIIHSPNGRYGIFHNGSDVMYVTPESLNSSLAAHKARKSKKEGQS